MSALRFLRSAPTVCGSEWTARRMYFNNLVTLSVMALGLIATITHILQDWKTLPNVKDMELEGVYRETVSGPYAWGSPRLDRLRLDE